MDPDVLLTIGLAILVLSIPSMLSAVSEGRAPRASALTLLIAFGCILYAMSTAPGGYRLDDIPAAVMRAVGQFI